MQGKNNTKVINFSDRFKNLLKTSGMTQVEAAKQLEVSQGAINFWISGRNDPKGKELFRISKLFGVSVDWLLTGEAPKTEDSATQMWRERAILAEQKIEMLKAGLKGMLKKI